ncbi:hypothetical protein [Paracoccus sp. (in: a-proteobacteria)]|uniref:hypothetical protein n=1 Tax=Paracoccus sp. TaxID=267 RepID=UPI0026DECE31|nr:hypothetical protein [Paracoccus sp. (in: a-proteobacteria)]MDO5370272.1 hypothetical protein [Paracoccus sp. (in: a-proteobacteria)]
MRISKEVLDELLKGVERPGDLPGDAGLVKEMKVPCWMPVHPVRVRPSSWILV